MRRPLPSLESALLMAKYERMHPTPEEPDNTCGLCWGTGEGPADGVRCPRCKGTGEDPPAAPR